MENEDFEEVKRNFEAKDELTSLIEAELSVNNVSFDSEKVRNIKSKINKYYENPDLMLGLSDDQRKFYDKFLNVLAVNNELNKNKSNQMVLSPDDSNGQNGFLNIIFLSILVIMITLLVIHIMN